MIPNLSTDSARGAPFGRLERAAAVIEVVSVFCLMHAAFRSFKQLSPLGAWEHDEGLNFSPGVCMTVITIILLQVTRRDWRQYGLAIGTSKCPFQWSLRGAILALAAYLPPTLIYFRKTDNAGHAAIVFGEVLSATAFGEEIFFRGYVQSRLNEAFGRPFLLGSVRFGWGLILCSVLFGFLHTLNTVDYFHDRFTFAWGWGLQTFFSGLLFGYLRERSGSIVLPAIVHGVCDIWVIAFLH
jgi:membrane protease YdiL (CAAX protease family)